MYDILQLHTLTHKTSLPATGGPQLVYVLIELMSDPEAEIIRLPLNFALVLDRSGSMEGDKIQTVKHAFNNILDQLTLTDVVSVITFESETVVVSPAQALGENRRHLKHLVDQIEAEGGTEMAPAIRAGLEQVRKNLSGDRLNRILLLTDGEATDELADSRAEADQCAYANAPIIGMGIGRYWNEDFVQELADRSIGAAGTRSGHSYYIRSPDDAAQVFADVFQSMRVVAKNLTLTVRLVRGMEARHVWLVTPLIKDVSKSAVMGRALTVPIADLEMGGTSVLLELMLPPRQPGRYRIAQADLRYVLPQHHHYLGKVAADILLDVGADSPLNGKVMNIVEKVTAFKLQTEALEEAAHDPGSATRKLRQAITLLLDLGETEMAEAMQVEVDRLERGEGLSPEGKKTIKVLARKTRKIAGSP